MAGPHVGGDRGVGATIDGMSSSPVSPNRPGRPRAAADGAASPLSGREQILDAAAALFVESGFSGTSTRAIADRVGIRQQSLYYHFAGKDEILVELLSNSVRPSNEFVRSIESRVPHDAGAAGALYALASVDARTLRRTPHNIGVLYLHPEVQDERFDVFRQERAQLRAAYGRLGAAAAHPDVKAGLDESRLGMLLIQIAEVVIQLRRDGETDAEDDATVAASCLRLIGLTTSEIETARAEAVDLIRLAEESETVLSASEV
jgi:AcrR family transcriptional regulator